MAELTKTVGGKVMPLSQSDLAQRAADIAADEAGAAARARAAAIAARKAAYPDIGDQLDAIWKQLNQDRLGGKALIQEADDMLGNILIVKRDIPVPD